MESVIKKENITCVIPFYNEDDGNIRITLYTLLAIPEITQFILVDDGSKSKRVFNKIFKNFSHIHPVKLIRLKHNVGKATAVSYGVNKSINENILLVDSDLENLKISEFKNAISRFKKENLDMLILKRNSSLPLVKLFRTNTLLSGERLIKKNHLVKILGTDVKGFELEIAINQYFINKKLEEKCSWISSSAKNNYKFKKMNFFEGLYKDFKMYKNLISYVGLKKYIHQVLNFCK